MNKIDLCFPVSGDTLKVDNAYSLFASLSKVRGEHLTEDVSLFPIRSRRMSPLLMKIDETSEVILRTPLGKIPFFMDLAGKTLTVDGFEIKLGRPSLKQLEPRECLYSRIVAFKNLWDETSFKVKMEKALASRGISCEIIVPKTKSGFFRKRSVSIKGHRTFGYSVYLKGLGLEDSRVILEQGVGLSRHMGCGIFLPLRELNIANLQ